jgi:mRNA interferase RelE/StbE
LAWTLDYSDTALKQLRTLDKQTARRILNYLDERVAAGGTPRSAGKALTGPLGGLWRYRAGDYRIICDIEDTVMRVLVVQIGNRREIYR